MEISQFNASFPMTREVILIEGCSLPSVFDFGFEGERLQGFSNVHLSLKSNEANEKTF
jgi:hypothetical protein